MTDLIIQAGILLFSCAAIWLVGRRERWSRWGFIVGLAGQPFWFYGTAREGQWGMFLVTCWFTYSYMQGVWNFWIRKEEA